MKIQTRDGSRERAILTAMIVNKTVVGQIASKWDGRNFASPVGNIFGKLAVDFYRKHGDAPKAAIPNLFHRWAEKNHHDEDTIELAEKLLAYLSDEYEKSSDEINPDHILDLAHEEFNLVKARRLKESLESSIEAKDVEKIKKDIASFNWTELGGESFTDLLSEDDMVRSCFEQKEDCLIQYPGALGDFFGNALSRDSLISFLAPEKTGKTFWLIDVAVRAAAQRNKVAFFEVGDMSKKQIHRRFYTKIAEHPISPGKVRIPTEIKVTRDATGKEESEVEFEEKEFREGLNAAISIAACQRFQKKVIKSDKSHLRITCHPNSTVTVQDIKAAVQRMILDDFVPTVICIDYADILAPPMEKMEVRDAINTSWKQLRALSQEFHCLVVTATQADAESYDRHTMDRRNFSEDKRKLSHANGIVGINVTPAEKEKQVMRLNWIVLREGEYSPRRCCHVAGCLALAEPAMVSGMYERKARKRLANDE